MPALRAHEGDEVQGAQVDLEELLQVVRLHRYLWTPRAIALLEVQPGEDRDASEDPTVVQRCADSRIPGGKCK